MDNAQTQYFVFVFCLCFVFGFFPYLQNIPKYSKSNDKMLVPRFKTAEPRSKS